MSVRVVVMSPILDLECHSRSANTNGSSSQRSHPTSLSNKFEALEKKWSLYSKFGDLEKKWSQFSSAAAMVTTAAKAPKIIKIEDLEHKWAQLHAFAKQEKMQQQRKQSNQFVQEDTKETLEENRQDQSDTQPSQSYLTYITHKGDEARELEPVGLEPQELAQLETIGAEKDTPEYSQECKEFGEGTPEESSMMTETEISALTLEEELELEIQAECKDPGEQQADPWDEPEIKSGEQPDPRLRGSVNESIEQPDQRDEPVTSIAMEQDHPVIDLMTAKAKTGFTLKRRGAKRPRRFFALTKVRQWGLGHVKSKAEQEEEVHFESRNTAETSIGTLSESREETIPEEDVSQRVLASMPNHMLWQTHDTHGATLVESSGTNGGYFHGEPDSSGDLQGRQKKGNIQFSAVFHRAASGQIDGSKVQPRRNRSGMRESSIQVPLKGELHRDCISTGTNDIPTSATSPSPTRLIQPIVRDTWHEQLRTHSATMIQSLVRRNLACCRVGKIRIVTPHSPESKRRRDLLSPTFARIQSLRKFQNGERYRKNAAVVQSAYRCWRLRKQYVRLKNTMINLQRVCRGYLVRNRTALAAASAQRLWLAHSRDRNVSGQLYCDSSAISALSSDVSTSFDGQTEVTLHASTKSSVISVGPGNPLTNSPLPPLHPASSFPLRTKSSQRSCSSPRSQESLQEKPTLSPPAHPSLCLPPLSPAQRPRGTSSGQSIRPSGAQQGAEAVRTRRRSTSLSKGLSPSRMHTSSRERGRGDYVTPTSGNNSKMEERSSSPYVSPMRKKLIISPLANIISSSFDEATTKRQKRHERVKKPAPHSAQKHAPNRFHGTKSLLIVRHQGNRKTRNVKLTKSYFQDDIQGHNFTGIEFHDASAMKNNEVAMLGSDQEHAASTCFQKVWRGYRSHLALASMLANQSTVVCECSNETVSRDRTLRQNANVVSVSKAISQVGCLGGNERLYFSKAEIIADWRNILYINLALPNGSVVNTFSTVHARTCLQRSPLIETLSREKIFKLAVKAALLHHLSEQQHKVLRMSLFKRSLTRRRAPLAKESAIQIQKAARRWLFKRRYTRVREAALVIQKVVRCSQTARAYFHLRRGAISVQAFFRGELVRGIVFQYWSAALALRGFWNQHRQARLAEADSLVSKIQGVCRGMQSRKVLLQRWSAAIMMQSLFRTFAARKRFRVVRVLCRSLQLLSRRRLALRIQQENLAAISVQRWWRFEQYNNMMRGLCATIIEASYRRYRDVYQFRCMRHVALSIQAHQRGHSVRHLLHQKRQASTEISRFFREKIFRRKIARFLRAATLIASWYQAIEQKRLYAKQRRWNFLSNLCATQIQSQYRMFSAQFKYQQVKWSVAVLQYRIRKRLHQKRQREMKAAERMQAIWRGWFERSNFIYLKYCIVSAQSAFRRYQQQQRAQAMTAASILIQARWRSHCGRFNFHIHRGATIFLQRTWTQYRIDRAMKRELATRLVALTRQRFARRAFQSRKNAVHRIQTWQRGARARSAFLQQRKASIQIQAFWRKLHSEAYYTLFRILVVQLQACFRRRRQLMGFRVALCTLVMIQRMSRGFCQRRKFLRIRKAVRTAQHYSRRRLRQKHVMAVVIQKEYRRASLKLIFCHAKSSVIRIQRHWRMVVIQSKYRQQHRKAKVIQTSTRRYFQCVRQMRELSATTLQSWYRCHIMRLKYVIYLFSIALSQSAWRSYKLRREYRGVRNAARRLQACYRRKKTQKALLGIQSFLQRLMNRKRGHVILAQKRKAIKVELIRILRMERMKASHERESAAIVLQYCYRKHRKQACIIAARIRDGEKLLFEQNWAALCVQLNWRCHICKRRFLIKQRSALFLVARLKALLYGKMSRSRYMDTRRALLLIQSYWRGFLRRSSYTKLCKRLEYLRSRAEHWQVTKIRSVTLVQRQWRLHCCRTGYIELRKAVVVLQSWWRSLCAHRSYYQLCNGFKILQKVARRKNKRVAQRRRMYAKKWHAVVLIQRQWRLQRALCSYKAIKSGVLKLQVLTRQIQRRARLTNAIILIQIRWRRTSCRTFYIRQRRATIVMQSQWRTWLVLKAFQILRLRLAQLQHLSEQMRWRKNAIHLAILLQQHGRMHSCKERYSKERRMVILLQSQWRSCYHRSRFQVYKKQGKAATAIQGQWRSTTSRSIFVRTKEGIVKMQRYAGRKWRRKERAITGLQHWWRMVSWRQKYKMERHAAVMIQKLWRRKQIQCDFIKLQIRYRQKHLCSIVVQRNWRKCAARQRYHCLLRTFIRVQSLWRSKQSRHIYKTTRTALVRFQRKTQSRFRGRTVAATVIQRDWRTLTTRASYRLYFFSMVLIQQRHRALLSKRLVLTGSVRIQRIWRSYRCRCNVAARTLQRRWRSRCSWNREKQSVCQIQSAFRGVKGRRLFKEKVAAAVCLQAWFRSCISRFKLLIKVICATIVQAVFRGHCQRRLYADARTSATNIAHQWRKIGMRSSAAISIQSFWRSFQTKISYRTIYQRIILLQQLVRQRYDLKLKLVVSIQKSWRMRETQHKHLYLKSSLTISRRRACKIRYTKWRSGIATLQRTTKQKQQCTLKIQAVWRIHCTQLWFRRFRSMVVRVQSHWRGTKRRSQFQWAKISIIRLQSHWRGLSTYRKYNAFRHGIVTLQARWKLLFPLKVNAAICVQTCVRRAMSQVLFQEVLVAAVTLQALTRRFVIQAKYQRILNIIAFMQIKWKHSHMVKILSATQFQSNARMLIWRSKFLQKKSAATNIQCQWRRFAKQQDFQWFLLRVVPLQNKWRKHFLLKVLSATHLQSYARMVIGQAALRQEQAAATILQTQWRRFAGHQAYQSSHWAIISLQRSWKSAFMVKILAATQLQSNARMSLWRSKFLRKKSAATNIQSYWRRSACQNDFQLFLHGAVILQKNWRKHFLLKVLYATHIQKWARMVMAQSKLQQMQVSATIMQSQWRKFLAQCDYKKFLLGMVTLQMRWKKHILNRMCSATLLQSYARMSFWWSTFLQKKSAATIIQCHWRRSACQNDFQLFLGGAVTLQKNWRKHFLLKVLSATYIQNWARMVMAQSQLQQMQFSVTIIQSHWRRFLGQYDYKKFLLGMVTFQIRWKEHILNRMRSATLLQSYARMVVSQSQHWQTRCATICIQFHWRRFHSKLKLQTCEAGTRKLQATWMHFYLHKVIMAIRLQTFARMNSSRAYCCRKRHAIVFLQAHWRGLTQRFLYRRLCSGITMLQTIAFGIHEKKSKAIIKLQKYWRMSLCYSRFTLVVSAAKLLQRHWWKWSFRRLRQRMVLLQHVVKRWFAFRTAASTTLQSTWRMQSCKSRYQWKHKMLLRLQSSLRGCTARKIFQMTKHGVLLLQSKGRVWLALRQKSGLTIQRQWRMWTSKSNFRATQRGFVRLQAQYRMGGCHLRYKMCLKGLSRLQSVIRDRFTQRLRACISIQSAARICLLTLRLRRPELVEALILLQKHAKAAFERKVKSTVKVQCWFRGRSTRAKYLSLRQDELFALLGRRKRVVLTIILAMLVTQLAFNSMLGSSSGYQPQKCWVQNETLLLLGTSSGGFLEAFIVPDATQREGHRVTNTSTNEAPKRRLSASEISAQTTQQGFILTPGEEVFPDSAVQTLGGSATERFQDPQVGLRTENCSEHSTPLTVVHQLKLWSKVQAKPFPSLELQKEIVFQANSKRLDSSIAEDQTLRLLSYSTSMPTSTMATQRASADSGATHLKKSRSRAHATATSKHAADGWSLLDVVSGFLWELHQPPIMARLADIFCQLVNLVGYTDYPIALAVQQGESASMAVLSHHVSNVKPSEILLFLLAASFLILTVTALHMISQGSFVALLTLCTSVFTPRGLHGNPHQQAAIRTQASWRRRKAKTVYLKTEIKCEVLQNLLRKWHREKQIRIAIVKIQQHFRLNRYRSRMCDAILNSQHCTFPPIMVGGRVLLEINCSVMWVDTALWIVGLCQRRPITHWFVVIQVLRSKFIYRQLYKITEHTIKKTIQKVTIIQRAFRRLLAILKAGKGSRGTQEIGTIGCFAKLKYFKLAEKQASHENDNPPDQDLFTPSSSSFHRRILDFLKEEQGASRIQSWWRQTKMLTMIQATTIIQRKFRSFKRLKNTVRLHSAACTIQRYLLSHLLAKKKKRLVNEALKQLLLHRLHSLSSIVLQRWVRMTLARSKYRLQIQQLLRVPNSEGRNTAGIEEGEAADGESRSQSSGEDINHKEVTTLDKFVNELWEEQRLGRRPLVDQLLFDGLSSCDSDAEVTNGAEGQSSWCGSQGFFQIRPTQDSIVLVTETEAGVELSVVDTVELLNSVQCCGFGIF